MWLVALGPGTVSTQVGSKSGTHPWNPGLRSLIIPGLWCSVRRSAMRTWLTLLTLKGCLGASSSACWFCYIYLYPSHSFLQWTHHRLLKYLLLLLLIARSNLKSVVVVRISFKNFFDRLLHLDLKFFFVFINQWIVIINFSIYFFSTFLFKSWFNLSIVYLEEELKFDLAEY